MSQRLEIVRARDDPSELRDMAAEAVRWWIGAPAHAHAVAAGFYARAGDLDAARRELDTVLALPDWRTDRSYLWSIFIGELAAAAIALDDRALCQLLLDDLLPLADTCAVNGALVCFMGAHAHRIGLLLRRPRPSRTGPRTGSTGRCEIHRRLGARAWQAETHRAAALGGADAPNMPAGAALDRTGAGNRTAPSHRRRRRPLTTRRRHVAGQLPRTRGLSARRQGAARPGRPAGPPGTDLSALSLAGGEVPPQRARAAPSRSSTGPR